MPEPLVIVEDLQKSFLHMGRELQVLRGIDLTIYAGDVMAIVGASGAGKSTLLHCIGTLDLPTSGSIQLGGRELVGLRDGELAAIRNQTIGFVFQFHHLLPEFNALENVMMPGLIQGAPRPALQKRATELLEEVGLGHRITHRPGELSGGEQQRVALARALVLSPKLILADEPTGNLDSATSDAIHALFFEINRRHGTTIVVVTHNIAFANQMPRVVSMRDGRVESDEGKPDSQEAPSDTPSRREARVEQLERRRMREAVKPADFWIRFGARAADALLVLGGSVAAVLLGLSVVRQDIKVPLLAQPLPPVFGPPPLSWTVVLLALGGLFSAVVLYHTFPERFGGASLGKVLTGLRVRDEDLGPPTFKGALLRNLAYPVVDALLCGLVGYVAISGSPRRQRIGDRWGGTVVVRARTLDAPPGVLRILLGNVAGLALMFVVMLVATVAALTLG